MTRINLVTPDELSNQHLVAEYREIFMIGSALQRSLKSPHWHATKQSLPHAFTLNTGHVKFFYNKGKYLHKRYNLIIREMKSRGFKPDKERKFPKEIFKNNNLYSNWIPNSNDLKIIRQRISEKIAMKPYWYRITKKK